MSENGRNIFLKILYGIVKIITFPIYAIFYAIKKLIEKSRFSIRVSLSLMHLKIVFRTLLLTGLLIFFANGIYTMYFVFENYYLIIDNIISSQKIEYKTLKEITGDKYYVVVYDKNKKFLFSTASTDSTNSTGMKNPIDSTNSIDSMKDSMSSVDLITNPTDPNTDSNNLNNSTNTSNSISEKNKHKKIIDFTMADNRNFIVLDKKILLSGTTFYLNIYTDITDEIKDMLYLLKIILLVNTGGIIFAFILSIVIGRNIFLPIKEMTEAAKSISDKNMNVRLNVTGSKNELKDLAKTFNEMMDRIEDGYNRQKQFVSDASHELRTPIAVLQGYIDMLDRWGKNDKGVLQESIDAIKNESENMKDLLEKLLFLARNDRGTLTLQKEEFSLTNLVEETVKETEIIDKSHKLICNIENKIYINADRNRIKQALRIFLDNAIKYTPKSGKITINLTTEKKYAAIEIIDTGIGMSEEEIKHAFDRFYRSDKSRKRERGGHGLGLSIAKLIILGHRGKINIKSKPYEGTRIKVFLPF